MTLQTGELVNQRYRIVKILGQGGFGAVYRAWDTSFNMPCALKENLETSAEAQRQFEREARLLRTMKHANLPLVTDYFFLPSRGQYLVMDYIEGQDLEQLMAQRGGPLPVELALDWIGQICDALAYLHAQDQPVIHRDIKPANIRITESSAFPNGQAFLVDFGIAKTYDPGLKTTTGARALTPGYAPFEQYGMGRTDARTDLYALGATLYTLLTGERPVESVQRTIQDSLAPPEQLNPALPPALSAAVRRAMAMDPDRRFQRAAEFKAALASPHAAAQPDALVAVAPTYVVSAAGAAPAAAEKMPAQARPAGAARPGGVAKSGPLTWGLLAGAALVGLVVLGVGAVVVFGLVFKGFQPAEPSPTIPAATTQAPGGGATLEVATPTLPGEAIETEQSLPSSTPFTTLEKPADVPVMPGGDNLQVFEMTPAQGSVSKIISITFNTDASVDEITAYYEAEMPANGWGKVSTYSDGKTLVIMFQKGERVAQVMVSQASGRNTVAVNVMEQ